MTLLVFCVLFLALTGHSCALYCLCKDGVGNQALQKAIDYACANGADCTPILQNGPCYQPNTMKDHCSYAVNSYYQRKQSTGGTCDFSGSASTSSTPPSTATSGCVYPSSASNAGTGTTTPSTGSPGTSPSITPPRSGSGSGSGTSPSITPPGSGSGSGSGSGTTNGSPNVFGISPTSTTGTGGFNDSEAVMAHLEGTKTKIILSLFLTTLWLALRV